jgi:hypothetical protein
MGLIWKGSGNGSVCTVPPPLLLPLSLNGFSFIHLWPSPPERIWFGIGIGIGIGLVHGSAQGSMIPRYQAPYVQLPPVSRSFYATVSTLL